ncbi:MAG TPA: aminotransferase class III-fold pyridoxal phosphate-dependent enzyme, partial [Ignavibacteria bacterium]
EVTTEFVKKINELKNKYEFLVIADEIQSGVGRTGKLHACEHHNLDADVVILAKGIGGGLPLGAILGSERVEDVFTYGEHGSTFGGSPVAASCGLVIFEELQKGLMNKVVELGDYLKTKLNELKGKLPNAIKEVRGRGLMLGVELFAEGEPIMKKLLDNNVLVNYTNQNVIRLLPPYILTKSDIDLFIGKFEDALL